MRDGSPGSRRPRDDESKRGVLPLPVAPPEQPPPEDDRWPASAHTASGASDIRGVERLLDEWMRRLERRIETLAERIPRHQGSPRGGAVLKQVSTLPTAGGQDEVTKQVGRPIVSAWETPQVCIVKPPSDQPHQHREHSPAQDPSLGGDGCPLTPLSGRNDEDPSVGGDGCPLTPRSGRNDEEPVQKTPSATSGAPRFLGGAHSEVVNATSSAASKKVKRATTEERIARHWDDLANESAAKEGLAHQIISHKYFDCVITAVVLFSAIMVGVQVDYEVRHDGRQLQVLDYIEYVCTGIFTMELVLRIMALKLAVLCSKGERGLFTVDVVLVFISWVDIAFSLLSSVAGLGTSAFVTKAFKLVRIGRIMRIIRTVRLLAELRVMANMIWNSFRSLMWLFSILVALGYCFALVLTQGASMYMTGAGVLPSERERLMNYFGSILLTMYSLFKSMTGGINWGEIADMIEPAGYVYSAMVVLYILINLFSVLNVVTGVFVDGAIELGKRDRSMMIRKQGQKREASAQHLVQLLRDMDTEGNGFITREEFLASMHRYEVREFMMALSIDLKDADKMFTLLDRNMDGMVDIVEFVQGMEKLRGEAKSSDIHFLIMQCQLIADAIRTLQGTAGSLALESLSLSEGMVAKGSATSRGVHAKKVSGSAGGIAQDPCWDLAFCDLGAVVAQKHRRSSVSEDRRRGSERS